MATNFVETYRNIVKDVADKADSFIKSLRAAAEEKGKIEAAKEAMKPAESMSMVQDLTQPGASAYDTDTKTYYYTYKPGDTFGQVIKDLGLESGNGLWGENGDVAYYTQQLYDQGITGNIPVGTTIRLRHRNTPTPEIGKIVQDAKYPSLQQVIRSGARKV